MVYSIYALPLQTDVMIWLAELWYAYPLAGFAAFVLYMLANPQKVEKWHSMLSRLFAWFSNRAEKSSVAGDIQHRISSFVKGSGVGEALPYGLRIKWVSDDTIESYVEQKEVVVIMKKHNNNAKNFINVLSAYFEQGFLPGVRNFVHPDIVKGAEITLQRKIVQKQRPDATVLFKRVEEADRKDPNVDVYCKRFSDIDSKGLFKHVFLEEIMFAGRRFSEMDPGVVKDDVDEFVQLLCNIASKNPGEDIKLEHFGAAIQTRIMLIARIEKIRAGYEPYVNRVKEAIALQYDSVSDGPRRKNRLHRTPDRVDRKQHGRTPRLDQRDASVGCGRTQTDRVGVAVQALNHRKSGALAYSCPQAATGRNARARPFSGPDPDRRRWA